MGLLKKAKEEVVLQPVEDGLWAGSNIVEVFDTSGRTRMSCGIHELFASDTLVEAAPVDDVLYILEGEIEIQAGGISQTYHAGDFVYLFAGFEQRFIVREHVKHVYVCYPSNWKSEEE